MSWFKQPARHALAAKGIQTRIGRAQLDLAEHGNHPPGTFLKGARFEQLARSIGKRYSEGSEIDQADYERAVGPLFEALASADLLIDRGDIQGGLRQLDLAEKEFGALCEHANLMNDIDSKDFIEAARSISQKAIARSRIPTPAPAKPSAPVLFVQAPPTPIQHTKVAETQGGVDNSKTQ